MFTKPLLLNGGKDEYKIYRMTFAEAQTYDSTISVGFVIKNKSEKFKIVLVINDRLIGKPAASAYGTYGNGDDPYYNTPPDMGWFELRAYCSDPDIAHLGSFSIYFPYIDQTFNYDGETLTYYDYGEDSFYSIYLSSRPADSCYNRIIDLFNTYVREDNNDNVRTVDISYREGEGRYKGMVLRVNNISVGESAYVEWDFVPYTVQQTRYQLNSITLYYDENRVYSQTYNSLTASGSWTAPDPASVSDVGEHTVRIDFRVGMDAWWQNEQYDISKTFTVT
jgi:hypothetical protein